MYVLLVRAVVYAPSNKLTLSYVPLSPVAGETAQPNRNIRTCFVVNYTVDVQNILQPNLPTDYLQDEEQLKSGLLLPGT